MRTPRLAIQEAEPLQQLDRTFVQAGRRRLAYFSGCDYYRLSQHPRLRTALGEATARFGLNVAASRVTTGNHVLFKKLERKLARFFGAEAALLLPSGYMAGVAVAQALAGEFGTAYLDERSHVSLGDAALFLGIPVKKFRHRDPEDLHRLLRAAGTLVRPIVLTDGMFSRDGTLAPLAGYLRVLPRDGVILVDDAHGAGVVGATGRGTIEAAGVSRNRVIQTVTLSKAFGAYGGAVLGSDALRKKIVARSGLFAGATPLPLPLVAAALAGVGLMMERGAGLRRRLRANADHVKQTLRAAGMEVPDAPGPVLAVFPDSPKAARKLYLALLAAGIYPPLIRYPGGPPGGYFRFVISSEHTAEQLGRLTGVLSQFIGGVD